MDSEKGHTTFRTGTGNAQIVQIKLIVLSAVIELPVQMGPV